MKKKWFLIAGLMILILSGAVIWKNTCYRSVEPSYGTVNENDNGDRSVEAADSDSKGSEDGLLAGNQSVFEDSCLSEIPKEQEYVPTSIVVQAENVVPEDESRIIYRSENYAVLEYASEEEAKSAIEAYKEAGDAEARHEKTVWICDTGTSGYTYLSYGPSYIESSALVDKILAKYETADKAPAITVGVVDTGVNYNHPFLSGKVNLTKSYDLYNKDSDAMDDNKHGTHVAGIIVDTAFSNVKINAYKVANSSGGSNEVLLASGIDRAVADKVDVINISMGGNGNSTVVEEAIDSALAAGIMVVVASGNENQDTQGVFPAGYEPALTVANITDEGQRYYNSNYGDEVDLSAPGYEIRSTVLGSSYSKMTGTSMATPFVSAACALVKTYDPTLTVSEIETILKDSAKDLGDPGFDIFYGYGAVNLGQVFGKPTAPVIATKGCEFTSELMVTLTNKNRTGNIYYTVDGSIPNPNASGNTCVKYTGPFKLSATAKVQAVAVDKYGNVSDAVSENYYSRGAAIESDFTIDNNGNILSYSGKQTELAIPSSVNGITVTGIGTGAFASNNCKSLVTLVLPDTLKTVGNGAFSGCSNLARVFCKKNVTEKTKLTIGNGNILFTAATWYEYAGLIVEKMPDNTSFTEGTTPDLTGGVCIYVDPSRLITHVSMTDTLMTFGKMDNNTIGKTTVPIIYNSVSAELEMEVIAKVLKEISVTTKPATLEFLEGKDALSVTGGVITLYYNNGTSPTVNMTLDMVSGFDNTKVGEQKLTVKYLGKQTDYTVKIRAKAVTEIAINTDPDKIVFGYLIDDLEVKGGKLDVSYDNGTSSVIDMEAEMVSGYDKSVLGEQELTITYGGKSTKYKVTVSIPDATVSYTTHVQNVGWQSYVSNGVMAGTSGRALRLEGIKIRFTDAPYEGDITYATHIQNIGWQDEVEGLKMNDEMSGTEGRALRLEAIHINLTGQMGEYYDVYYRVHAQNIGWMGWAKNGSDAGTAGYGYRLEGIQIVLVAKGGAAPGSTAGAFKEKGVGLSDGDPDKLQISYTTHVQNIGWQDYVTDGEMAGTSGRALRLEGIKIRLINQPYEGDIEYCTHIQNIGWESEMKKNDGFSGTSGKAYRLEAIRIRLTGEMASHYDVYYCVHAQNIGWMGWAKNGESAGTAGYAYRLEGIRIVLVPIGGEAPGALGNTEEAFVDKNK